MQCPKCNQLLGEDVKFCPHDGTPLVETGATKADSTPTGGQRSASKELDLPVTVGNRYHLVELRGGGGMAKVYRATDLTLEREVAVKLINPDLRNETEFDSRFEREARIASKLADPHIVVVHDFGLDTTHGPFLVMEFLQGQSLRERLGTGGPMPVKAGLQLAGQLVLALIHAHGKGIVHRDIKPDNIFLLNQSGVRLHVRVLDFGIARIYSRDDSTRAETLTHVGAVLGTPRYMSPEQLAGQPVDARSDIYSTALVIHEALTGQLPYYQGKKLCELCPEASAPLQDLIDQCLKPNPAERPPTAVEVYLRLQELGKASGILLLPPGAMDRLIASRKVSEPTVQYTPEEGKARIKRRFLIALASLIAVLALAAGVKYLFFSGLGSYDGPESLHGIKLGDSSEEAGDKVSLTRADVGNPWKRATKDSLGHILKPADLQLRDTEVAALTTLRSPDKRLCVLFHNNKVVAIVSSERGTATACGLQMGAGVKPLFKLYPQGAQAHDVPLPDKSHVEVRRYPALGIGFEIQNGRITGMTLFPPVKEDESGS
jgi:serine/threonine protein kinase